MSVELSPCSNHRASEKVKAVEVVTGSVEIQLRFDVSRERQGLLAGLSAGGGGRAGSTEFEDAAVCLAPAGPTRDAMREMDAENKLLLLRAWRRSESSQEARQPPPPLPGRRSAAARLAFTACAANLLLPLQFGRCSNMRVDGPPLV